MPERATVVLYLLLAACGPEKSGNVPTTDGAVSTGNTSTGNTSTGIPTSGGTTATDAAGESDGSTATDTTGEPVSDQELCQDFCDHAQSCGFDEGCVENCVANLDDADMMGCGPESRASRRCEAMNPLDYKCSEASACAAAYIPFDVCYYGSCAHLGGGSTTTVSPDECSWGALLCYGHKLEMKCSPTPDAQCSCRVDDVELSTCALGVDLEPDVCSDAFSAFKGCCTEVFVAALQP